jgi:SRSO17 transposase
LAQFAERYQSHFKSLTRNVAQVAGQYLKGLFQSRKKNMERMEEMVPEADEQRFQHFLSESPWDDQSVMEQVAKGADPILGGKADSSLILDESAFTKKGTHSVGVARQYNGRMGKVDNCQVGVFSALSSGTKVCPVGTRLFLPVKWTRNRKRCCKAGVPQQRFKHQTKQELALELVKQARQQGLRFKWVQGDGAYGHDLKFCRNLDDLGERFLLDVHKNKRIYLEDPAVAVSEKGSKSAATSQRLRTKVKATTAQKWAKRQPKSDWQSLKLRDSTKGEIIVEVVHRRVWVWDGKTQRVDQWWLLAQRDQAGDYKYTLSNAAETMDWKELAIQSAQRYWIERCFEDGKGKVGMGDCQARGWVSWHHHMAMVMMAMLFLLEERQYNQSAMPLISCTDVVELLCCALPSRKVDGQELLRQIKLRHEKRQASIDAAYAKQRTQKMSSSGST